MQVNSDFSWKNQRIGIFLCLITVFQWSLQPLALRVALDEVSSATVATVRFAVAFVLALSLSIARHLQTSGRGEALPRPRRRDLALLAAAAVCLSGDYLLYQKGLALSSPMNAQVLTQLAPLFMGLGALVFFGETLSRAQVAGLFAVLVSGYAFFHEQLSVLARESEVTGQRYSDGSLLLVLAALLWAVFGLAQKQLGKRFPNHWVMTVLYGLCGLILVPTASWAEISAASGKAKLALAICGACTLIAYHALAYALQRIDANRVSAILANTPVATVALSFAVALIFPAWAKPEHLSLWVIVGGLGVVLGSIRMALK